MDAVLGAAAAAAALVSIGEVVEDAVVDPEERLGSIGFLGMSASPGSRDETSEAARGPPGWPSMT